MRVLGVEVSGSDSRLVILDGTSKNFQIEYLSTSRVLLPPDCEQVNRLASLKGQLYAVLISQKVDCVAVIRADEGCSPIRAKIEYVIQMAAKDASLPCELVPVQTVNAAEKRKVARVAGEDVARNLMEIKPAYLKKAVHCAWSTLHGLGQ